jgi:hypothetical protein
MLTEEEHVEAEALHRRGWSIAAIARHLGRDRKTIRAYLRGQRTAGVRRRAESDHFGLFRSEWGEPRRRLRAVGRQEPPSSLRLLKAATTRRPLTMADANGAAEAMLGLDGFRVLEVEQTASEVLVRIETTADLVGCPGCGIVATAQDRMAVAYRDLAAFGRPARLVWSKRRWRCAEPGCCVRTWTEGSAAFSARCLLTNRAGRECCLQVGLNARPVAQMARELGVCWHTVMAAVSEHGEPLVDDPARVGAVVQLGVDETTWLSATKDHPTRYATGLVDLERRIVIDVVEGNRGEDGRLARPEARVLARRDPGRGHRPCRVLPVGPRGPPRPRDPGGRPVSRGPPRQPLPGPGAPARAERNARPPRSKTRSALPDPKRSW